MKKPNHKPSPDRKLKDNKPAALSASDYGVSTYGERVAEVYDGWHGARENIDAVVGFLAALAGKGRALELGIGTGRVAIGLAARGVRVNGIDASPAMVAKMRAKPGGDAIPVTIADFAGVPAKGQFSLVYVVFNTFFCLLSQDEQVRCFTRAAKRLRPDGAFLIEAFVPDLTRFDRNQRVGVIHIGGNETHLELARHDPLNQRSTSQRLVISAKEGLRLYPVQVRYGWPSELDLMARIAGMRLRERWAGWNREPFTAASQSHVSVYELNRAYPRIP